LASVFGRFYSEKSREMYFMIRTSPFTAVNRRTYCDFLRPWLAFF